ncbi:MAG: glycosyltransferase family 39 protein [Anaerolineae bacterium]|nr:glycosyltransferase family 39 protein [Anaerolineae bacterium]
MTNTNPPVKTQNSQPPLSSLFSPLLLVAFSLALTLHALAADSLWGDEIFTATFANQSVGEVIRWTANDIHPPLYYLLAGTFARLTVPLGVTALPTQVSDWLWRFPSAIFTVLTVAVTYRLAYHLSRVTHHVSRMHYASRFIATSAALLLCLAPIAVKYAQEARMHALFMFLSALSTWLFFRALAQPRQWTRWLAFALATAANIYTMYFGFLILAAQTGFLFFLILKLQITNRKSQIANYRLQIVGFSAVVMAVFLLYAPWWPVLFNILRKRAAVGAIEGGVGRPVDFMRGVVQALGPSPEPVAWIFFLLFIIGLIFLIWRGRWPLAAFAALWLGLPVALPIFLGDPRALQFRYAFVLPVYLVTAAYAVYQVGRAAHQYANKARGLAPAGPQAGATRPPPANLVVFLFWLLATVSFMATLDIYNQTKPNWRSAAAYLDAHAAPADIILAGPLWDEGRFIGYYYRGQAQILTPAAMVTNIERHAESLRANGGQVWAVNRFAPAESPALQNITFSGVALSEPQLTVYEPALLAAAALDLAAQAVDAAYPWAAQAEAQGVLNPDPRTAQAAALRAWGDALVAAGRPEEALAPYQTAVNIFPGWVDGLLALAETQELLGNLPAAVAAYREAVSFNFKWQGPPANKAAALAEAGQMELALEKYHQIIKE